ncbi:MAG: hypothetical protein ACRC92_18695 [Peptostreptococcaceae bacterium]
MKAYKIYINGKDGKRRCCIQCGINPDSLTLCTKGKFHLNRLDTQEYIMNLAYRTIFTIGHTEDEVRARYGIPKSTFDEFLKKNNLEIPKVLFNRYVKVYEEYVSSKGGESIRKLCEKYELNVSNCYLYLRRNGYKYSSRGNQHEDQSTNPVYLYYMQSDLSMRAVSRHFGKNERYLQSLIKRCGLEKRK